MTKNTKPTVVPTILSSKGSIWCALLVGYFLAVLAAYNVQGRISSLRSQLKQTVVSRAETRLFTVTLPQGWEEYSVAGDAVEMRRRAGERFPSVQVIARRDRAYAYTALDSNPAMLLRRCEDAYVKSGGESKQLSGLGSEEVLIRPGVPAISQHLEIGSSRQGHAFLFYVGDIRYFALAVWDDNDRETEAEIEDWTRHFPERIELPVCREAIDRPVVNSQDVTVELSRKVHEAVDREFALWQLFRQRARTQPEAYMMEAIQHYREVLRLLSSVRAERPQLDTEDFAEYRGYLARRAAIVREWFVRLDKLIGMKDFEKARKQAEYIIAHATLVDESLDKHRASEILAEITQPPPQE